MNRLADNIISTAVAWYERNCYETSNNRGTCIDDIHEQYSSDWIERNTNEAYCAEFVSVVLKTAFQKLGVNSPLYTSSAVGMLQEAKDKGISVNRKPAAGAIFYKRSKAAGSTGHVGIIVETLGDGNTFNTVEGNATDPRTGKEGVVSIRRSMSSDSTLQIIHVESVLGEGESSVVMAGVNKWQVFFLLMVAAGVVYTKYKHTT
jgi:hypothetical protein